MKIDKREKIELNLSKSEIKSAEKLYDYLISKLPDSLDFKDLYNLCFSLFCTLDILPKNLRSLKTTKSVLAITFMKISEIKNITDCANQINWIEQIDSFFKLESNYPNHENVRILLDIN